MDAGQAWTMLNPVLLDVPEAFETERLSIRVVRPGDGASVNEAALETLAELQAWMPWSDPAPSVEQSEEYARRAYSQFVVRENFPLRLVEKTSGLYVGAVGLHVRGWQVPKFEIGYWCRKRFQGQGLISEAVTAALQLGFQLLGARRIEIRCDARNERSRRVAERVGMRREAELRNFAVDREGTLHDDLVFAMTDDDWHGLPQSAARLRVVG
jgi:RimJ/RimL family protein N-acetyltransferase